MLENIQPTVSIVIKALNEERHIASAIESALASLTDIDGEVILADGGSDDRTIEIARRYPITIVQLNNAADRSCGSGAQLGFQYTSGRYIYIVDGDMQLRPVFLPSAVRFLEENPSVAGVGGIVIDCDVTNLEYAQRTHRQDPDRHAGPVTRLHSGGLYRRSAIESIGYLTDRNLHGAEELDLGARLHARGWTLARIDCRSVDHYGHSGSAYRLLLRRVVTRNSGALGEIVRAAIGRSHFWLVVGKDKNTLLCLLVAGWWATLMVIPFVLSGYAAMFGMAIVFLFPFVSMSLRWRSVSNALYSVAAWNVYTLSFLPGFMRSRVSPTSWIESTILKERLPSDKPHGSVVRGTAANLDSEHSRISASLSGR